MNPLTSSAAPVSPAFLRRRALWNNISRYVLMLAALTSVLVTVGIVYVLISESLPFFQHVAITDFLTDTQWTPMFENAHFGVMTLVSATLTVAGIALAVAIPAGLGLAIYLSEYANDKVRETVKPFLELLEGVPTVVYGFFALLFVTPLLQTFLPGLSGFNLLAPGIVMGIMILPYTASVSEDAMRSVPMQLREAGYALGYSRFRVATHVVIPAALSGITAACILGMSRAVGETMVVAIAAGQNPRFGFDPTEGAATITSFIVQMAMGDLPHGTIAYQSVFAAGLVLFLITLLFNIIGFYLRRRFREAY
ncbi:phosphate ABC transporter permease subunit PstC [Photobacterium halotolerans]|uniref:Phosphate transport system permease protein n=1 Tax=Photobacterium halotolerans TaxID=265726 RepID=A0A7X4WDC9_9GAMM|nr:phosphate ABC transporter permease subunit PstC [Photobacterium halotolerans]NAW66593.1 phosphate ABC transporter permease subunit PstC [Photobacterium halotolerans]NAW87265.1 phosphate ABC transporter permease subunit PstC [Photobacterium halotolerans]